MTSVSSALPAQPLSPQKSPEIPMNMPTGTSLAGMDPGNVSTDDAGTADTKRQGVRNPACDHCREKKIRCDREKPLCMNCRTANTACKYSEPQKRPSDVSRNIHRFQEVNQRLDRIESSIAALTSAITAFSKNQALAAAAPQPNAQNTPCSCNSSAPNSTNGGTPKSRVADEFPSPGGNTQSVPSIIASYIQLKGRSFMKTRDIVNAPVPDTSLYMGSSSIASMTNEAEMLAQEKLGTKEMALREKKPTSKGKTDDTKGPDTGPLDRLGIISKKVAGLIPHFSHRVLRNDAAHFERSIPSREEANELIDIYFNSSHRIYPLFDEQSFRADMERMYDEPEVSIKDGSWVACFNCALLFGMHVKVVNMNLRERTQLDLSSYSRTILSFYNAWAALDDLEVFITPKLRNIQGLVAMAICAIEVSRPALSWSLLAQAARSAQALGLHRRTQPAGLTEAEIEERKKLFWQIQIWLSTLSLTLGRSATLPEFECDVEIPAENGDPLFRFTLAHIGLSKLQANIYRGLYSAAAANKTANELNDTIEELHAELEGWWSEWKHLATPPSEAAVKPEQSDREQSDSSDDKPAPQKITHMELFQHIHIHFNYYNLQTLILRMARPGMRVYSATKTLTAARTSIQVAMDALKAHPDLASSALPLWLFTCHPFTSFFVLFAAIIRNPSSPDSTATDLPLMNRLVTYFTALSKRNEGAARLLAVTSSFTNVAAVFLKNYQEAKKRKRDPADDGPDIDDSSTAIDLAAGMLELDDAPMDMHEDLLSPQGGNPSMFSFGISSQFSGFPGSQSFQVPNLYGSALSSGSPAPVDFATAAFLRWPEMGSASRNGGGVMATLPPSMVMGGGASLGPQHHHIQHQQQQQQHQPRPHPHQHHPNHSHHPHHPHQPPHHQARPPNHHPPGQPHGHPHHANAQHPRQRPPPQHQPNGVDLQQLMAEPLDFQMRMEQAARRGPLEFDWYGFEGAFQQFPGGQMGGAGFPGTGLRRAMGDGGGQLGHLHQG